MIKVHRLNGKEVVVNAELIESIETVPDTVITLYTGNRFVVQESMDTVHQLVLEYKRAVHKPTSDNKE
jgi:flagellar protein FlbD